MKAETRIKIAKRVTVGVCVFLVCDCLWILANIHLMYSPPEAFFLMLFYCLFSILLISIYLMLAWPARQRKNKQTAILGILYILCMIGAFLWYPHGLETVVVLTPILVLQGVLGLLGIKNTEQTKLNAIKKEDSDQQKPEIKER